MAIRAETVGILSLGAMGSAVADALGRGGVRVVATTDGRSARTIALAARTGVELLPDGSAVIGEADVVLSIVPPEAAVAVATDIAEAAVAASAAPLVVDLNAIAPTTSLQIGSLVTQPAASTSTARSPDHRRGRRGRRASTWPERAPPTSRSCSSRRRADRRGERGGRGVGGEDEHGVRLQGKLGARPAGAPSRTRERRPRPRARRPANRLAGARREDREAARLGCVEVWPLRGRDARDRRDPGRRRPHAVALRGNCRRVCGAVGNAAGPA